MSDQDIQFEAMERPGPGELLEFYERQQHATTRSLEKLQSMIDETTVFVVARRAGQIVGLARGVCDGVCGRIAECKLDPALQGPGCVTRKDGRIEHDTAGVGSKMATLVMEGLRGQGVERIEVLAYGTEVDFCEELGFRVMAGVVAMEWTAEASHPASSVVSTGASCLIGVARDGGGKG